MMERKRWLIDAEDLLGAVNMDYHDPKFDCLIYRAPVVDAVEVVRCAQCLYSFRDDESQRLRCGIHDLTLMEITEQSFCSAGMTEAQWLARYGDELEDGDLLKPTKEQPMHRILDLGDRQESGLLEED